MLSPMETYSKPIGYSICSFPGGGRSIPLRPSPTGFAHEQITHINTADDLNRGHFRCVLQAFKG